MGVYQFFKNIRIFFKLLFSQGPMVYWWSYSEKFNSKLENFGDVITPYIILRLSGFYPIFFNVNSKFSRFFKHYLMTGSIIGLSKKKSIVWGSGIITRNEKISGGRFLAVRGPRTAKRLKELGFDSPSFFGDPGLLISKLYMPNINKEFKYGVIPHYEDYNSFREKNAISDDVLIINLLTENVENVIDDILKCNKIISSSLHGIIIAHAYGIPALWWKMSNKLGGDDIKFVDYFESVDLLNVKNHEYFSLAKIIEDGLFVLPNKKTIEKRQKDLLHTYPFKLK